MRQIIVFLCLQLVLLMTLSSFYRARRKTTKMSTAALMLLYMNERKVAG